MTKTDIENYISELGLEDEGVILFENPDYASAFIGLTTDNKAVYDHTKMADFLCETENMEPEEADDFISYNTLRALPYFGDKAPVVIFSLVPRDNGGH